MRHISLLLKYNSLSHSFVVSCFFCNRHVESIEEPRFAPMDQQAPGMGPRVLPVGPSTNSGPRRGPLDSSVPYSALQPKKNKPKKPRREPAIGK